MGRSFRSDMIQLIETGAYSVAVFLSIRAARTDSC